MYVIIHTRRETGDVEAVLLVESHEDAVSKAVEYAIRSLSGPWNDETIRELEDDIRRDHHYCGFDEQTDRDRQDRIFIRRGFVAASKLAATTS